MKLKIQIKTVEGMAKSSMIKMRPFFGLTKGKAKYEAWCNKEDDTLYVEVDGSIRDCKRIEENVNRFSKIKQTFTKSKAGKLAMKTLGATQEQIVQLQELFDNDTNIEVVKMATAQELIDENKTFWERMKEKFTKVE